MGGAPAYVGAMRRRLALTLLVAVAIAGTVGGSADARSGPSDRDLATAAFLTASDFPAGEGWVRHPPTPSGTLRGAACAAINRVRSASQRYRFSSPSFQAQNAAAEESVYVFPTARQAQRYVSVFRRKTAERCIHKYATRVFPNATIEITRIDTTGVGDDGVGFAITATGTSVQGSPDIVVVDIPSYRVGRVFVGFTFSSTDEPLDIQQDVVHSAIARLGRALRG